MRLASTRLGIVASILVAIAGCGGGRASLPPPRRPLVRTPDESFRRMPQPDPVAPLEVPAVHRTTLASGLEVQVVSRRELPLVAIVIASRAFRTIDAEMPPGVASLTGRVIERELERIASTDPSRELPAPDVTVTTDGILIATQVPSSELVRALAQISASLRADECHEGDVELARLSLRSSAQQTGTVGGLAEIALNAALYGNEDRRAIPSWGSAAIVEQIAPTHCAQQRRRGLVPGATTIAIVGDVSAEDAVRHVEGTIGGWSRPMPTPASATSAAPPTFPIAPRNVMLVPTRSPEGAVMLAERGPGPREPGYVAFGVLTRLVGGMFGARLNMELRERRGWAYGVSAERTVAVDHSTLRIECTVHGSRVLETLEVIEEELQRLSRPAQIEEEELATAIAAERASLLDRLESRAGIAYAIALASMRGLTLDHLAEQDRALAAMSATDVARVASQVRIGGAPVVLIGPAAIAQSIDRARPGRFAMLVPQ